MLTGISGWLWPRSQLDASKAVTGEGSPPVAVRDKSRSCLRTSARRGSLHQCPMNLNRQGEPSTQPETARSVSRKTLGKKLVQSRLNQLVPDRVGRFRKSALASRQQNVDGVRPSVHGGKSNASISVSSKRCSGGSARPAPSPRAGTVSASPCPGELVGKDFDRDIPAELSVPCSIHRSHPALARWARGPRSGRVCGRVRVAEWLAVYEIISYDVRSLWRLAHDHPHPMSFLTLHPRLIVFDREHRRTGLADA